MTKYLSNAFSLQMLEGDANIEVVEVSKDAVPFNEVISTIGHQDIATLLGVPVNRVNTRLKGDDTLYVAQYIGDRLPEGVTILPKGAVIKFFKVTVSYKNESFYSVQAGDKFCSNFFYGNVTIRSVTGTSAIIDFDSPRESYRNGEEWELSDIREELDSKDAIRLRITSPKDKKKKEISLWGNLNDFAFFVNAGELQNVCSRIIGKNDDGNIFQIEYNGEWYYAQEFDFE